MSIEFPLRIEIAIFNHFCRISIRIRFYEKYVNNIILLINHIINWLDNNVLNRVLRYTINSLRTNIYLYRRYMNNNKKKIN